LTVVAGRPTLADVDALRLLAALNPREADDETPCVVWHCPDCGAFKAPLPDLVARDGKDAAWFCSR